MSDTAAQNTLPPASEQELANLITDIADRLGQGENITLESVCDQYPQYASDFRELWGMLVVTHAAGKTSVQPSGDVTSDFQPPVLKLPYSLGDYVLQSEIGRGGMGVVYHAIRNSDGQPVAIKMLLKGDFASTAELQRFESEARSAGRLQHPHIIPIYDVGEHEGRPYFCMKLIEGQPLSSRLANGPLPARRAARLLTQVSDAISYAHSEGVLHRDLKPSNIMLDDDGVAYVADFGLAKQEQETKQNSLTRTGAVVGTPSYMSPEQAAGNRGSIGVASDVYSLGAILYHALAGRPPFLGSSPVDTVMMVLEQNPIAPRVFNRRADRSLEMIAMRCLQKPQDLRYSDAASLATDLRRFLQDEPVSASEGRFGQLIGNVFRETHHAEVLENWGLLWMWHSLVLLIVSLKTQLLYSLGNENRISYWLMWTFGLGTWAVVFWLMRRKMGPVMFIERQIAHVWAAAMCCVAFLFPLEAVLHLEVLSLAPLLAVIAGMVFLVKAGTLSGSFYVHSIVMFATAFVMALVPKFALVWFGVAASSCFFTAGLKYYRRKLQQAD